MLQLLRGLAREVVPAQLRYLTSRTQVSRQLEILLPSYNLPPRGFSRADDVIQRHQITPRCRMNVTRIDCQQITDCSSAFPRIFPPPLYCLQGITAHYLRMSRCSDVPAYCVALSQRDMLDTRGRVATTQSVDDSQ